jgi:hypothetical protein
VSEEVRFAGPLFFGGASLRLAKGTDSSIPRGGATEFPPPIARCGANLGGTCGGATGGLARRPLFGARPCSWGASGRRRSCGSPRPGMADLAWWMARCALWRAGCWAMMPRSASGGMAGETRVPRRKAQRTGMKGGHGARSAAVGGVLGSRPTRAGVEELTSGSGEGSWRAGR